MRRSLSTLDFSIFKKPKISVDDFFIRSGEINREIVNLNRRLLEIAPDSHHSHILNASNKIVQEFNEYRFKFLAQKIRTNSNPDEVVTKLLKEFHSKLEKAARRNDSDKKIDELKAKIAELKESLSRENVDAVKQAEAELAKEIALKQQQFRNDLQNIQNIGVGISSVLQLADSKLGAFASITTATFIQIADPINLLSSGNLTGVASFGQYGLMANASIRLLLSYGVFGGGSKDGFASALKQIARQIQKFQERMDTRIDRIENQLFNYNKEVLQHFALIEDSLYEVDISVRLAYNQIMQLEKKILNLQAEENSKAIPITPESSHGKCGDNEAGEKCIGKKGLAGYKGGAGWF